MFGKLGRKMDFKSIRKIGKNPLTRYCCLNFSMVPVDFGKKKPLYPCTTFTRFISVNSKDRSVLEFYNFSWGLKN